MANPCDGGFPESTLPIPGIGSVTWRPCEEDLSIWRLFCLWPDRELLATFDLSRAELLSFDVEWEIPEGRRRFVTWSTGRGFSSGTTDSERTIDDPGDGTGGVDPGILGMALVIVEGAGVDSPVTTWILERLSAPVARG